MKVIMLSRVARLYHGYGGMQRYITSLSEHLVKQGVEVEVLISLPEKGKNPGSQEYQEYKGVKYTFLPPYIPDNILSFWYTYHLFSKKAAQYLEKTEFDILHSFGFPAFFYLWRRERRPVIVQPFGCESFKTKSIEKLVNYLMWYPQSWYTMQRADSIASEGEIQSSEIKQIYKVSKDKIFILPDGVDLQEIDSYLNASPLRRQDIGLEKDDFVLINVNRLEANKGVNFLIEALHLLAKQITNIKLIIIGTGSKEGELLGQIKDLKLEDRVIHLKNVEDSLLFAYYRLADIAVVPTLFEGLPLVLLEALACRLPVVATDISENHQIVKNGENGYLVPPADPMAIVQAVQEIYRKGEAKNMGEVSRKIVERYDWSIVAAKAIEEYERLLRD